VLRTASPINHLLSIRNVRRYSPTLYTAAHCTPRSEEAQSKYTESEKEKETLQEDSGSRMLKIYQKLHRAKNPMHSSSTKEHICTKDCFFIKDTNDCYFYISNAAKLLSD